MALIHNAKPQFKDPELPADYYSECDSPKTIQAIAKAIEADGHRVFPVEADIHLPEWLLQNRVDVAFNIAEGFYGEAREACVPALLDLLEIPYTGSGVAAQVLALDKYRSKQIFRSLGIPTPNSQIFVTGEEPLDARLHFPLIVKPNREGSSKGISAQSVVRSEKALRAQIGKVRRDYDQEVIVEEFVEGTELTVGILGEEILPVLEVDFSPCAQAGETFYSWRVKEFQGNKEMHLDPEFWCPARLDLVSLQATRSVAKKAAEALNCRDFARVDIRLSSDGIPYVLEVNTLPGLDPEESNVPMMTRAAGIPYQELIRRILQLAIERSGKGSGKVVAAAPSEQEKSAYSSIPSLKKNNAGPEERPQAELPDAADRQPGLRVGKLPC